MYVYCARKSMENAVCCFIEIWEEEQFEFASTIMHGLLTNHTACSIQVFFIMHRIVQYFIFYFTIYYIYLGLSANNVSK